MDNLEQPDMRPVSDDGKLYRLYKDFTLEGVTVPEGYRSDGASVPRYLWFIMPRDGLHRAAALIHDYLYEVEGHEGISRKRSDRLFLDSMLWYGVSRWRAHLAYCSVRLFGWIWWNF